MLAAALAALASVFVAFVSNDVLAAAVESGDGRIETLVITATRGGERSITSSPVPVDVIDASQIASAGAYGNELAQTLQNLVPSFNLARQSNSGSADIVRPAQLRGMSPDQVLVLVNGKRRHTTSITGIDSKVGRGTAPVDFNSIPTNAIGRIEVLRDGAGSQYGSDAIAGVINVILDERDDGFDATVTYGSQLTDFAPTNDDFDDGEMMAVQIAGGIPLGDGGFLRAGAEYRDRNQTNRAGFDQVPFFEDPANIDLVGGQRNFAPGDGRSEDASFWVNTGIHLSEDVELYGFAMLSDRDAEGTGFFRYPVSSANLVEVHPLGYRPVTTGRNTDTSITTGVRGALDAWSWDASVSYGENDFDSGVRHTLNPSLGPTSPHSFDGGETENSLASLNFDVTRALDLAFTDAATLALGAEYRREEFVSQAGDPLWYTAGPLADDGFAIGAQAGTGLRPEEERDLDRNVYSLYTELSADLSDSVFADTSVRYEDSDDFGSTVSGKLAARWEFFEGFALRGAVSNSFRAPSLVQVGFATSSTSFGTGGQLTTVNTLPVDDPVARALGADDLDAETSVNYSVGLTGEVTQSLTVTVDVFRIDVDDRITLSERIDCGPTTVPPTAAALCATRNITAANFFTNAVDTRTEGVEVVVTYLMELMGGTLNASLAYSSADTDIEDVNDPSVSGVVILGVEERNTIEGAAPEDKAVGTLTWQNDSFSALTRVSYFGETTRIFNFGGGFEPEQTYGSEWQLDAELSVQVVDTVQLFVGGTNLLDEYPDKSSSDINFFGNLPYDVLSPLGFQGRYVYGGARIAL